MAYYDTIRNPSTFVKRASSERMKNFHFLHQLKDWKTAVSSWDREHLFACRLICSAPQRRLPLFVEGNFYPVHLRVHECIRRLIMGPPNHATLADKWEPQILKQYEPDTLGYVWAALAPFLRAEAANDQSSTAASRRSTRERAIPERFGDFESSTDYQIGSSSPTGRDSVASGGSSIGYTEKMSAPLLEDLTIRLASCFIRCVLNYAEPLNTTPPFIHFRDERRAYSYAAQTTRFFEAIDDGGVQLFTNGQMFQVAILEGKRTFQTFVDEKPTVSDQVLAQMVGETLALGSDPAGFSLSQSDFITIFTVAHYVKFFHFHITNDFMEKFETCSIVDKEACFLEADSTDWFDINSKGHREEIVSHLLALVTWAVDVARSN
ncbi:hypothetical protein TOPH_03346 [Tolypocladium ophioglossoides CBS 100239]|uniref:Uncharacterized protein n=1 Tax=Tolypocladium ophioglossoides (strain CBS 100239) TaxID=1163406 RepID=A0A0L0NDI9_TOLOC|nr:hypothetical protein TOPH_03346 [Tolypocladium ophioglossoides CBS 100239]